MDDLDRRLITELQSDPRQNHTKLTRSLGISEHTVGKRIERLVSSGEIIFTALPYMKLFGYNTSAYVGLRLKQKSKSSSIAMQLCKMPQIRYVSSCEGFADIFFGGDYKSNEELSNFISDYVAKIDGISQVNTMVELKQIKEQSFGRFGIQNLKRKIVPQVGDIVIDEIDHRIILELQKDCRIPIKKLAQLINKSEQTINRRIKNLVASGAIELAAMVSDKVIAYAQNVFIAVEVELPKLNNVAETIAVNPLIGNAGIYSGSLQVLAYIQTTSPEDVYDFTNRQLVNIDGVNRIDWLINLKVLKRGFSWIR
jgi:Lrp/AsnC family transcriptional regulator, regulator for asnA, asnC and gidA